MWRAMAGGLASPSRVLLGKGGEGGNVEGGNPADDVFLRRENGEGRPMIGWPREPYPKEKEGEKKTPLASTAFFEEVNGEGRPGMGWTREP